MDREEFKEIVNNGIERGKDFMCVRIETEGNPRAEIIINPSENFASKIAYYLKAYNDRMELKTAKESGKLIKITDVLMTSNLNDLSWFVY